MAYMDYNGMVREGLNPNATPGPGGASPWSPWGAALPNAYETGFEPRNYAPKPASNLNGQQPTNLYQTPHLTAPQPLAPMSPLNLGGSNGQAQQPTQSGGGGSMGTYRTGIEHGLLSNDAISQARQRLQPTAPMPRMTQGIPVSGAQQGSLGTQYGDLMRQGTQSADTSLQRDAAYQQQQMQLAQQKALAAATSAGFGNLIGADATNTQYNQSLQQQNQARRGMLLNLLTGMM